jgi:hypothetical protein
LIEASSSARVFQAARRISNKHRDEGESKPPGFHLFSLLPPDTITLSHEVKSEFAGFFNSERIWFKVIQHHILQLYWESLLGQNISSDIEAIPPVRLLGWHVAVEMMRT